MNARKSRRTPQSGASPDPVDRARALVAEPATPPKKRPRAQREAADERPVIGHVPVPEGFHPEGYALAVKGAGMAPDIGDGQFVLVEPIPPQCGELAVLYFKDQPVPAVIRMGNSFKPYLLGWHPGSEVDPLVEVSARNSPKALFVRASRLHAAHRVHSIVGPDGEPIATFPKPEEQA